MAMSSLRVGFHLALDEARDHFLLNSVITLKPKDFIADLAEGRDGPEGDQLALLFQLGEFGVDGNVHLHAAQGGLLRFGCVLVLGDDGQIRVVAYLERHTHA